MDGEFLPSGQKHPLVGLGISACQNTLLCIEHDHSIISVSVTSQLDIDLLLLSYSTMADVVLVRDRSGE
jgi:hypothetical protein